MRSLGRKMAKARDEWFNSEPAKACLKGKAEGVYLKNRLEVAFLAGIQAGIKIKETPNEVDKH